MINKLSKSQSFIPNINLKQSFHELERIQENFCISPNNSLSQSYIKKQSVQNFKNNFINLKKIHFMFIIFYIIIYSFQLGIFSFGIDLLKKEFYQVNEIDLFLFYFGNGKFI